jgi:hypothetical protein
MNSTFIIEPKYDNGVGFLVLDNTRKLVRHFECIISQKIDMTIDIYEDGLIQIYKKIKLPIRDMGGCFVNNHPDNIIDLLLSLELTNGEHINEHYLDLLESIYSPFCEKDYDPNLKYDSLYNQMRGITIYLKPIITWFGPSQRDGSLDYLLLEEEKSELFMKTFKTLHIMKKMYETSFIN